MSVPGDTINIRTATIDDAAEIARIYNFYIRAGGITFDIEDYPAARITRLLNRGGSDAWFVAGDPGALLGWASARQFSERHGYRHSCETAIYLDDQAVGSGVGDLLQQRVEQHCRNSGIRHAMAKIVADNQRSLDFHYRHGYELVGTQNQIGRVDGRWVDVVILQRIF
jgi:phosphinothricin acetyltransferase